MREGDPMKEKLYTIPLTDAFLANDECPLCFISRKLEQDALDYTLGSGSSYMESDTREKTDALGFCATHFHKMYSYGNTLGNALILETYLKKVNKEFEKMQSKYSPIQKNMFKNSKAPREPFTSFVSEKESGCYICNYVNSSFERYISTFFYLLQKDKDFLTMIKNSKGLCFHHLGSILNKAPTYLSEQEQALFMPTIISASKDGLKRIEEDVSWLVSKFDYQNKEADWKNSKDALSRGIQKVVGGYPADKPYESKK